MPGSAIDKQATKYPGNHPLYTPMTHVWGHACHWGFLSILVRPEGLKEGFAAYFVSTLDLSGSNHQRLASVLMHVQSMTAPAEVASSLNVWDYTNKDGRLEWLESHFDALRPHLGLGQGHLNFLAALNQWPRGQMPFLGMVRDEVSTYAMPLLVLRDQFLYPAGRLLEACHNEKHLPKDLQKPVCYNLEQHCKKLGAGPRY